MRVCNEKGFPKTKTPKVEVVVLRFCDRFGMYSHIKATLTAICVKQEHPTRLALHAAPKYIGTFSEEKELPNFQEHTMQQTMSKFATLGGLIQLHPARSSGSDSIQSALPHLQHASALTASNLTKDAELSQLLVSVPSRLQGAKHFDAQRKWCNHQPLQ